MIINDHGPKKYMITYFFTGIHGVYMGIYWYIYIRYWSYFCPYGIFLTYFYAVHSDRSSSFKYIQNLKNDKDFHIIFGFKSGGLENLVNSFFTKKYISEGYVVWFIFCLYRWYIQVYQKLPKSNPNIF